MKKHCEGGVLVHALREMFHVTEEHLRNERNFSLCLIKSGMAENFLLLSF
jgi:hypothetical protein